MSSNLQFSGEPDSALLPSAFGFLGFCTKLLNNASKAACSQPRERVRTLCLVSPMSPFCVHTCHPLLRLTHTAHYLLLFSLHRQSTAGSLVARKEKKRRDENSQLTHCYAGSSQRGVWTWIMNTFAFPPLKWDVIASIIPHPGARVSHFKYSVEWQRWLC